MARRLFAFLAFALASVTAYAQAPSPPLTTLRVLAFDGGWNLPIWAAQRNGLFEAQGLNVQLAYTPTSGFLVTSVLDGKADIAFAAIDNVVAYQEGQGEAKIADNPDLFAFMGGDGGFISIVSAPAITSVAELKGKTRFGRRDDDRLRVRRCASSSRATASPKPTSTSFAPAAPPTGIAISSRASTTRRCCARRSSCSRETRGHHTIATAETLGPYQGTVGHRAAQLGARARARASSVSCARTRPRRTGCTTPRTATSPRRCSSRTSAT